MSRSINEISEALNQRIEGHRWVDNYLELIYVNEVTVDVPGLGPVDYVGVQHISGQDHMFIVAFEGKFYGHKYTYNSWDDNSFYHVNVREVRPVKKTIIEYEVVDD